MSNKYCNLQGTQKISESYNNINVGFDQVENDIEENKTKIHNHINGVSDRHDAEVITYSGIVPGATNVKQAIDNTRNRVEEIITTPSESVSAQEIIDARGGYISLGGRLDAFESQMADTAKIRINAIDPPSPLTAAVGDGIADDTAALQAMLTYLNDLGGGTLILPPNHTFKTTYSLFYGSNISIIGYGATISFNPSHADATCFVPLTYRSEDSFTTNVYFAGFKLVSSDPSKGNGIGTPKVKYMTIRDVWTDQLHWHLVDIAAGKNITVDNCHAENLTTAAFQADNLSSSGGMYAELSDGSLVSAIIDNDVCDNVKIINCTAKNGTGTGFHMHREGGKNILVQGCTFEALTTGIISDANTNWYNVILKNNQIINCKQGIWLEAAHHDLIIESNVVDIIGVYGIAVQQNSTSAVRNVGTKSHIIKNNVVKNAQKGIALDWSLNAIVQGNVLESCADDGRTLNYESSKDPSLYGMSIYKCNNTLVLDNIFKDCSQGGLKVHIGDYGATNIPCDKLIIKNNIFKNTGNAIIFTGYWFSTDEYTTPHGSNVIINNNLIELGTNGFLGVIVGGIKGLIVCDNIIKTNNNVGLTIDYCTDIYVKNNKVSISNLADSGTRFGISLYASKGYIENNEVSGWESLSNNIGIRISHSNIEGLTFELPKVDAGATALIHYKANAKPTTSALAVGSTCKNTNPSAGDYYGWVYVGGAWKGYGLIQS